MRDTKLSSLIVLSLLLLALSLILICIWGYNIYTGAQKQKTELIKYKLSANASPSNSTRDSLLKIYTATIDKLDSRIDSTKISADSLLGNVDNKLIEINKLREEISIILKSKNSIADIGTAREKIDELQVKVAQLQNRNLNIERENKRLRAFLQQLITDKGINGQAANRLPVADKVTNAKTNLTPAFFAADIRLTAVAIKDDQEEKSLQGEEIKKLNGSFIIKSSTYQNNAADIIVVVLQPNGKVLQNSVWESGTFDTNEGKKVYSLKIHVDYIKDEEKQLQFSLSTDKFQKGNYIVQVYHNGYVIGKMVKFLT
ncbi:MAG: hypothetical protein H7320_20385 [Ferruginibacter sp.]|nr:hypothetical protein [Ferruginibacter sp.]